MNGIRWARTGALVTLCLSCACALGLAGCIDQGDDLALPGPDPPAIDAILPDSAAVGDTIQLVGANFGNTPGEVHFSGTPPMARGQDVSVVPATVVSWSDTLIGATVPAGATSGTVRVIASGVSSNGIIFEVPGAPSVPLLLTLVPARTVVGDTVRIGGENLGPDQDARIVRFTAAAGGTLDAVAIAWSDSVVSALVPAGAGDGDIVIDNQGAVSNGLFFEVSPALVTYTQVNAIFNGDYACTVCHGPGFSEAHLDVASWSSLMSGTSDHGPVVIPRHGEESILVQKLRDPPPFGARMPQFSDPMAEADIQRIVEWIDQGARNN